MKKTATLVLGILFAIHSFSQEKSLVNTKNSPFAKLMPVNMGDAEWTNGFWAERFGVCKNSMVPHMMGNYLSDSISHAFLNFEIAAGLKAGEHIGPPFHDGDFYKMLEAEIVVFGITHDKEIGKQIDQIIDVIGKAQRADGYIHTPTSIKQLHHPDKKHEFNERLDFETYNMGHLMTAACIHYRITGNRKLLDIAIKSTDFLYQFFKTASAELARNAICPSHYMGVTEMYRTTNDPKYLELAKNLIEIRSMVENGTDHNQDRIPFKQQTEAMGHAVRANYLYAGVADVYCETGDDSLMLSLNKIWDDMVNRKLYITGACGALYDGVSPNGTTYNQPSIQQVHQAYGRAYELPNLTAHNESCANIGNLLWNWRMFLATGQARFIDILEEVAYNSLLAGVSLDGTGYFYTNPLSVALEHGLSDSLRWSKQREPYISYCNCCPPNTIRTIAEMQEYQYSVSPNGLWINLYGAGKLSTNLLNGSKIKLTQTTDFPWDGKIVIKLDDSPKDACSIFLRIPGWAEKYDLSVNGKVLGTKVSPGNYIEINRTWKKGDQIELVFPLKIKLMAANPLVENTRNQVAVKRGPVVYCIEEADMPAEISIFDITLPVYIELTTTPLLIGNSHLTALTGKAKHTPAASTNGRLYSPISKRNDEIEIKLIPYFAWGNRGKGNMSVWLPVSR